MITKLASTASHKPRIIFTSHATGRMAKWLDSQPEVPIHWNSVAKIHYTRIHCHVADIFRSVELLSANTQ